MDTELKQALKAGRTCLRGDGEHGAIPLVPASVVCALKLFVRLVVMPEHIVLH